ncbi:MAG: hypothetical protein LQ338_004932 [Usnochroma carphineum]|nr:MAG: hypothetical protein LQ338_004932 [Usnochroma carphineum]
MYTPRTTVTASIHFSNGSSFDVAKIEGDVAYKKTMRAPELLDTSLSSSDTQLFDQTSLMHAESLSRMMEALVKATESCLGTSSSISGAQIVVPFETTLSPVPARLFYILRSVAAALKLHVPRTVYQHAGALAARAYGLGGQCTYGAGSSQQLILTIDYSRAALTVVLMEEECLLIEVVQEVHDTGLGTDALSQVPISHSHASLARALRNITSRPLKDGWPCRISDIDEIVLLGESAGDQRLREVLKEVLGEHFVRHVRRAKLADPLFAAAKATAQDCLERMNSAPVTDCETQHWYSAG